MGECGHFTERYLLRRLSYPQAIERLAVSGVGGAMLVAMIKQAAADLLLGAGCPGCRRPGWGVCENCRQALLMAPHQVSRVTPSGVVLPAIWASTQYQLPTSALIVALKERGSWQLTGLLGQALATAVAAALLSVLESDAELGRDSNGRSWGEPILVPVPSQLTAVRARGYDHALELGRAGGRRFGLSCRPLLRRVKSAPDSVGASLSARWAAQQFTMAARPGSSDVMLVDDLVTTGASVAEATRALQVSGHRVVGVAVIAEVPKRGYQHGPDTPPVGADNG